jgi:hypothetical protein
VDSFIDSHVAGLGGWCLPYMAACCSTRHLVSVRQAWHLADPLTRRMAVATGRLGTEDSSARDASTNAHMTVSREDEALASHLAFVQSSLRLARGIDVDGPVVIDFNMADVLGHQ